jgi:hypothetical protein
MGELLGALGLAWPRLLLYPGGLFALGAGWLLARWLGWCAGAALPSAQPWHRATLAAALPPLAALSLLPLAPARAFPYGLDLFVALGLLEWPQLRMALAGGLNRAELLRGYGPLLLAALGLAEATGGLGLSQLLAWPSTGLAQALLLASATLWLAGLPPLLMTGPTGLAGRLRALGLLLLGVLPLLAALASQLAGLLPGPWAGRLLPLLAMSLAALGLGGLLRLPPHWLGRAQMALAVMVAGLVGAQYLS